MDGDCALQADSVLATQCRVFGPEPGCHGHAPVHGSVTSLCQQRACHDQVSCQWQIHIEFIGKLSRLVSSERISLSLHDS